MKKIAELTNLDVLKKVIEVKATLAGIRAFDAGKARVPAQDVEVRDLMTRYPGNAMLILDSWLAAWDPPVPVLVISGSQ